MLRDPTEDTNTLLVGIRGARVSVERLRQERAGLPFDLQQRADLDAAALGPRLDGGDLWTDDRAPVEWLVDRSIVGCGERGASGAAALPSSGPASAPPRPRRGRRTRPARAGPVSSQASIRSARASRRRSSKVRCPMETNVTELAGLAGQGRRRASTRTRSRRR